MANIGYDILINATTAETRVAVLESGKLQDIFIERPGAQSLVGNIYKGKVTRILPGMQSAFVEIGEARAGFLHVAELMPLLSDGQRPDLNIPEADIRRWVRDGQELLVQVLKDPLGSKGARLTSHISLASRHLVYLPDLPNIAVSLRLDDPIERQRLQSVMAAILGVEASKGYVVRTLAAGQNAEVLAGEVGYLKNAWQSMQQRVKEVQAPGLVYAELPLVNRLIRDVIKVSIRHIYVDTPAIYQALQDFCHTVMPELQEKLVQYVDPLPLFEAYGVEKKLQRALQRKLALPSGGYVVIDQTEAMAIIDVNTGSFVGKGSLEETAFKTNLEAAEVIATQLRLRNMGGIIVVDFIDLSLPAHRQTLLEKLSEWVAQDSAKVTLGTLSDLGLLEMTRKRTHESLLQQLCEVCSECQGRGHVKTFDTLSYEILRGLQREAATHSALLLVAAPAVIDHLQQCHQPALQHLEKLLKQPVQFRPEVHHSRELYDIISLS